MNRQIKQNQNNKKFNNNFHKKQNNSVFQLTENQVLICGRHPSFSALQNNKRKIYNIFITQNSEKELIDFLQKNSLLSLKNLIKIVEKDFIENLAKGSLAQNIVVIASKLKIKQQFDLLEELHNLEDKDCLPPLILLDEISDPHNVGAIIRSAVAFGVNKIIFCKHNAPSENSTIIKCAAGAIENADLIEVANFSNLMEKLKKIGYWCVGLAGEAKEDIAKIKNYKNIALVIGSEGAGIKNLVKKNCDLLVKIPINNVESLNASVAAALALYEISKNV
jgi:23S rRNA (guanosine2251-2'-O)-methyltransferase